MNDNGHLQRGAVVASLFLFCLGFMSVAEARDRAGAERGDRPRLKFRGVDRSDVRWTGGFWKQKFELVRGVTIPRMWEYFNAEHVGDDGRHWLSFRMAAGLEKGTWKGRSWDDGDFYKWLEAVAHVYAVTHDPELDRRMDEVIEVIGKAQQPDGYLSTRIILEKRERFQDIHHHELYNMGHLMTAACVHHDATGKANFLEIARKTGDYLYDTFKDRRPELAHFGFNPSNIMGAVELYRATGDRKYLDLANLFIDMRGSQPAGARHHGLGGTDQTQDRVPLRKESQAVGHAVTATYLYCGAADAYVESGDADLLKALQRIWLDVARRKLYIHGGIGPLTNGLSPRRDDVHEAFSDPYFLPNRKSYCETCSNIGNAMWNWRMLNITGEARYADVMERVFYNAGISGLGLDGDSFLYTNVLRRFGEEVPLLRSDRLERWKERAGYCCPPQLARTVAKMHGYAYSASRAGLWVHLYGSNVLETELRNGVSMRLRQQTQYPWKGDIRLTIESLGQEKRFDLNLRIPGWARGAKLLVNGTPVEADLAPGHYATLRRRWSEGDVVRLTLPMRPRLMQANPLVEEARGQVAVMRGPIVYCLESVDLPEGVDVMGVRLPRDIDLKARVVPDLLGGVTVLEGQAVYSRSEAWSGNAYDSETLYREVVPEASRRLPIRLIPYFAWLNRGISQMTVWLPAD